MTMVGSGAYGSVRSASSPCWVRAPVAKDPARQQVDDLEQHPASQPSRRPACWRSGRSATRSSIRAAHDRPGDRSPPMICTAARRFRPGTRPRWPRPALPLPPSRTSGGGCPSCARPAPPASSCATHPSEVRGSGPGADACVGTRGAPTRAGDVGVQCLARDPAGHTARRFPRPHGVVRDVQDELWRR